MKTILLVVIFNVNGNIAMIDGYMPREQPNHETCLERKEYMVDYLKKVPDLPEIERIACGTKEEIQDLIDMLSTSEKV